MSETMSSPTQQVSDWLAQFGGALSRGDVLAAVAMFDTESYWRDLVTFTWNIATLEGQDAIRDMLAAPLSEVQPSQWCAD
ncbi:MAG: hypothetical protein ETSY2_31240 [Candidatus Entotheonella gemina]|uniref:SnoaL-like domain-containing protein n=1 Tax=Candidatus Entotheonella gemina TaxID=1429439 RepID=W4M233_9BACT|nr:MAG: hypothetical protein ETSY2_31240 [Candidatus Entotheonella gemina]